MLLAAVTVVFLGLLVPGGSAGASALPAGVAVQRDSAKTAKLTVDVTDLPAKAAGSVRVTGPRGYNRALARTTALSGLVPGKYTITANQVVVAGTTYVPTVTDARPDLAAGSDPTSTVAYLTEIPAATVPLAASAVASVKATGAPSASP